MAQPDRTHRVDSESLTQMTMEAAHGRLVASVGHQLMNQQNGVQINEYLIRSFAASGALPGADVDSACKRLLDDSQASIEMFSLLRSLGKAICSEQTGRAHPVSGQTFERLLGYVAGHRATWVAVNSEPGCCISAEETVAIAAFVLGILPCIDGQIQLAVDSGKLSVQWRSGSSDQASAAMMAFNQPSVITPLSSALPLSLRHRGIAALTRRSGAECVIEFSVARSAS